MTLSARKREISVLTGLSINVPDWFQDQEFLAWLNDPARAVFTWHCKGEAPSEWSDVVVLVDPSLNGEGSDSDMPGRIWAEIVDLCRANFQPSTGCHIHVRLTNLED